MDVEITNMCMVLDPATRTVSNTGLGWLFLVGIWKEAKAL